MAHIKNMPIPVDSELPAKRESDVEPSAKPLDAEVVPVLVDSHGLPITENPPVPRRVVRLG